MLIVYVIGAPLLAFFVLFKNRKNLDKPEIIKYILLLYQGLRHERYYWELVNTLRKSTLLGLQVFVPDSYKIVKALVGVLVLFLWALLQARLNPFKIKLISRLGNLCVLTWIEHREMLASLLTLYGGLIFVQTDSQLQPLTIGFYVVIMIVNARFLILWAFWMLTVFKSRRYPGMLALYIKRIFWLIIDEVCANFIGILNFDYDCWYLL